MNDILIILIWAAVVLTVVGYVTRDRKRRDPNPYPSADDPDWKKIPGCIYRQPDAWYEGFEIIGEWSEEWDGDTTRGEPQ